MAGRQAPAPALRSRCACLRGLRVISGWSFRRRCTHSVPHSPKIPASFLISHVLLRMDSPGALRAGVGESLCTFSREGYYLLAFMT